MIHEIIGKLTGSEIAVIGALFTLFGTVIAGTFALVASVINGWFAEKKADREEENETMRQARELAVKLALEEWKIMNESAKEKYLIEQERKAKMGCVTVETYMPPMMNQTVEEMWSLTTSLMPKKSPKNAKSQLTTWKSWLNWPVTQLCEWWLNK